MGLNKQKGNMYKDITHTHNLLAGECPHKCSYCSTKKLMRYPHLKEKYSGDIRIARNELNTPLGRGNTIFVCAQNDLFANEVPEDMIKQILEYYRSFPKNKYIFQSKNPIRMKKLFNYFPKNSSFGTTIESNRIDLCNKYSAVSTPVDRAMGISLLHLVPTFITIEPVMDFDIGNFIKIISFANPDKVYIGADSGKNNLPEPNKEKLEVLIRRLSQMATVIQKNNLKRLMK